MDVMTLGEAKKVKECCSLAGRCDGCPIVGTDFCASVLAKHLATALEENEKLRADGKTAGHALDRLLDAHKRLAAGFGLSYEEDIAIQEYCQIQIDAIRKE